MTTIDEPTRQELDLAVAERLGLERGDSFAYSEEPQAFSCVKCEIERRGWGWACERHCDSSLETRFDIHRPKGEPGSYCDKFSAWADTEKVAGCRAFLKACEEEIDGED